MRPKLHNQRSVGDECAVEESGSPDRLIAELASRQRGVVSHKQLVAAGVKRKAINRRVRSGRLHTVHRGVYLVGHTVPANGAREVAAILACGTGAVVSHRSAANLWGPLPHPANPRLVDITVGGRHPGRRLGIRIHRVATLDRRDVRSLGRIPVTTPARTLLDLAAVVSSGDLERGRSRRAACANSWMPVASGISLNATPARQGPECCGSWSRPAGPSRARRPS